MPPQFVKPPYKFYSHHRKSDTWTVMFLNKPVMTENEVKLFFSKYGEVLETQFAKEICFVRFKSKEVAKRCATDMKNNGSIRLRPFRWAVDYDWGEELSDGEDVTSSGTDGKAASGQSSDNLHSSDAGSVGSKENSSEVKSPSQPLADGSQNEGIAQLFAPIHSPLIIEHVQAQEVIVANIPESCGVNLILDLFRQFRPICASNMKIIMENSLRYCHVYFESQRQAREVELIYDDAQLHGKRIIVLRSEALAAHAFVS